MKKLVIVLAIPIQLCVAMQSDFQKAELIIEQKTASLEDYRASIAKGLSEIKEKDIEENLREAQNASEELGRLLRRAKVCSTNTPINRLLRTAGMWGLGGLSVIAVLALVTYISNKVSSKETVASTDKANEELVKAYSKFLGKRGYIIVRNNDSELQQL